MSYCSLSVACNARGQAASHRLFSLARLFTLLTCTAILSSPTAQAATAPPGEAQWRAFNLDTVRHHVIPRYQALASAASTLKQSTAALCRQTDQPHLQQARNAFHDTLDAWQAIQHIRTGPIENQMRNYSMQFWPDKKNHVGRNLNELLVSKDSTLLDTREFYSLSVSVPGLPAVERLLFSDNSLKALKNDSFRCQVSQRIAAYIDEMASGLVQEWQTQRLPDYQTPGENDSFFGSNEEAAVELLKPLVTQPEVVRDNKLLHPLGANPDDARARRLESWRSERSLKNIRINIDTLRALYNGENPASADHSLKAMTPAAERQAIVQRFAHIETLLNRVEGPLETQIKNPQVHATLSEVTVQLKELSHQFDSLMNTLDIFLGFNSRDGD